MTVLGDMKKRLLLILMLSPTLVAQGIFEGSVIDHLGNGVANVPVWLVDHTGNLRGTLTDPAGHYQFRNVPNGWVLAYLDTPSGFFAFNPPCGFYQGAFDQYWEQDFHIAPRTGGVVVDFGSPGGVNGLAPPLHNSQVTFGLYAYNLNQQNQAPISTLKVTGYWMAPGHGAIDLVLQGWLLSGNYQNSMTSVDVTNHGGGWMTLIIDNPIQPHLNWDGHVANLTFQMSLQDDQAIQQARDRLVFCIDAVEVTQGTQTQNQT